MRRGKNNPRNPNITRMWNGTRPKNLPSIDFESLKSHEVEDGTLHLENLHERLQSLYSEEQLDFKRFKPSLINVDKKYGVKIRQYIL